MRQLRFRQLQLNYNYITFYHIQLQYLFHTMANGNSAVNTPLLALLPA